MMNKNREIAVVLLLGICLIAGCGKVTKNTGGFSEVKSEKSEDTEIKLSSVVSEEADNTEGETISVPTETTSSETDSAETTTDDKDEGKITDYATIITDKTITIYDIEDGYMEVPYYPELPQCEYDWSKLKLDGQVLSYDDPAYETCLGVDVSKFQGDVDWEKIASQGFSFAIIRLGFRGYGNGKLVTDECFEKNILGAKKAGLDVGVYFLSQAINETEAAEEAEYAVSELKRCGFGEIDYPIVVDSEKIKYDTSRTESMNGAERTDAVLAFCKAVEDAGYKSALYANSQWLTKELDIRRLTDINVWYADYQIFDNDEAPLYPYPFFMWQYTNKGKVDGINGDADLNICFRKYDADRISNNSDEDVERIISEMSLDQKIYRLYCGAYKAKRGMEDNG